MPGISEVSLHELAEIAKELDRDGMIKPHDLAHMFDVFRRGMGRAQGSSGQGLREESGSG